MELFLTNDEIESKINDIKQKIMLSMNGIVSDKMSKSGIIYKQNYGVSIPRIIEISKSYAPDSQLAKFLWAMQIRETMMLSVLIEPVNSFKTDLAKKRISEIKQLDLAEFASMYLFNKLTYSNELCIYCIFTDEMWPQITGFMIAGRIIEIINENEIRRITDRAFVLSCTNEFRLCRPIAGFLSKLCRKDKETAYYILNKIDKFKTSEIFGQQYIFETVEQEIKFLNLI